MSLSGEVGRKAEQAAARYLQGLGCRVLERGWRMPLGEIDLIVEDAQTLVFVEVKARSSRGLGPAEAAVDARKQRRLARAALAYVQARGIENRPMRFDVIAFQAGDVRHFKDAFTVEGYTR